MNARASPRRRATQVVIPLLLACACASSDSATSAVNGGAMTAAGSWHTTSTQFTLRDTLFVTGTAVTGQGTLTVSIPSYTGDAFVITSGEHSIIQT